MKATLYHRTEHLSDADVYSAEEKCPVCLSEATRTPVHRLQSNPVIDMLSCGHCGASSASHMPKPAVLSRYYGSYYSGSERKTTTPNPHRFAAHILKRMRKVPAAERLRILDYGGGDGSVSRAIADLLTSEHPSASISIVVVDYEQPEKSEGGKISVSGQRTLEPLQGGFDLIVASAVLEHVPQVNHEIRQLVALAAPGAQLYARTPFALPLAGLVPSLDLTYPAHVHDMGSSFWNRFAETFALDAELLWSGPSMVETAITEHPLRAIAAALMKLPCQIELAVNGNRPKDPLWKLVGGWEAVLQFR